MREIAESSREPIRVCESHLLARGLNKKEHAKKLDLSPYTVETHVRNILERLDATNRTQIGAWVMSQDGA